MKKTDIPFFKERSDLFKFLKTNQETLLAEKKYFPKHGDSLSFNQVLYDSKGQALKANTPIDISGLNELKVRVAINSTNIMDSHGDVHIPGIWKKSLSENKLIKHLQEHAMKFDHIIADGKDLKAFTEKISWLELGFKFAGESEVLVFESTIRKARNPYMFEQYSKGYVNNHSVGMQYVSMVLCINDDDPYFGAEYEAWQKYIEMVVNKDTAEKAGYFWAVKEAKVIEGSAVPIGSNYATPTLDNNVKTVPVEDHTAEPAKATPINYKYLVDNLKIN